MRNRSRFQSDFDRNHRRSGLFISLVGFFVTIGALLTFGFVGYQFYEEFAADKFTLRKDQYTCAASHVEAANNEVYTICDTYQRVR
ncbi:MAG: hypothetical protein EOP83_03535 [Verrucomicrobiaceae bacterium]|nr:MAG: hypothetical protein EOP83_03535 [Verrucomicrobiaceae bacterium]